MPPPPPPPPPPLPPLPSPSPTAWTVTPHAMAGGAAHTPQSLTLALLLLVRR